MLSPLPYNSMARLRDTDHEPIQRDVHSGATSVHRFPATFSDDIGGGRALMVSVALAEPIWDFSVRLCSGTLPQRAVKVTRSCAIRLQKVLHAWRLCYTAPGRKT